MRRALIRFQSTNLRFRRWSRAKYAAFVSVHRQVTMGQLASALADRFYAKQTLLHGGKKIAEQGGSSEEARGEAEEAEETLAARLPMDKYALWVALGISRQTASAEALQVGFHQIFVFIWHDGWVSRRDICPFSFYIQKMLVEDLKQQILAGKLLSESEALALLAEERESLYEAAHQITRHCMGNRFDTCSILNAKSGNCSEDCKWCAQSAHYPTQVRLYPLLSEAECVRHAAYHAQQGVGRLALVTSGRRVSSKEMQQIVGTVQAIRRTCSIKCCASMGLLDRDSLQALRASGVENYHCNIETAPSFFPKLCTTHTLAQKMETIRLAREAGFRICSGGIIGMGETMEQRVEMAAFLQRHRILSIPLNLLQPIPGTPLANQPRLSDEEILTTIALFRFLNPHAYLRFSGGRSQMSVELQRKALYVGINAAIVGDLLTTVGSRFEEDKRLFAEADYRLDEDTDWAS